MKEGAPEAIRFRFLKPLHGHELSESSWIFEIRWYHAEKSASYLLSVNSIGRVIQVYICLLTWCEALFFCLLKFFFVIQPSLWENMEILTFRAYQWLMFLILTFKLKFLVGQLGLKVDSKGQFFWRFSWKNKVPQFQSRIISMMFWHVQGIKKESFGLPEIIRNIKKW